MRSHFYIVHVVPQHRKMTTVEECHNQVILTLLQNFVNGVACVDNWRREYIFIYRVLRHYFFETIVFKV